MIEAVINHRGRGGGCDGLLAGTVVNWWCSVMWFGEELEMGAGSRGHGE
jgi:hypothetical protein